jgi:hypothetical protein
MFKDINLKQLIDSLHLVATYKFKVKSKKDRKKVQKKITQIIHEYRIPHTEYEYERSIGNGMKHGQCPVKCTLYINDHHQLVCVISDSGSGFDYREVTRKFMNKEIYYHHHGLGMRTLARNDHLHVDWISPGNTIILHYF